MEVNVQEFAGEPIIYNPAVPDEFMNQLLARRRPAAQRSTTDLYWKPRTQTPQCAG